MGFSPRPIAAAIGEKPQPLSIKAQTTFSLKDQLFNAESVQMLASALHRVEGTFNVEGFVSEALRQFPGLALKQRIFALVDLLEAHLPADYPAAVSWLQEALPPPLDPDLSDNDFGQFIWVVPGEYVARRGCNARDLERSLSFLAEATKRFSSELALRPFLSAFPETTLASVHQWASDEHYHLRRLASEGIRPFLPWGQRVVLPLPEIIAVLDRLQADPKRFVTRSVANTMNDVSRIDPELAVLTVARWRESTTQAPRERQWMEKHSLRTLLKNDDPGALALLGYTAAPSASLLEMHCDTQVQVGEPLSFSGRLVAHKQQRLRIHLRVYYPNVKGKLVPKVYALSDQQLLRDQELDLKKRISFKPQTTRTLYPGTHYAELVINGVAQERMPFELVV